MKKTVIFAFFSFVLASVTFAGLCKYTAETYTLRSEIEKEFHSHGGQREKNSFLVEG